MHGASQTGPVANLLNGRALQAVTDAAYSRLGDTEAASDLRLRQYATAELLADLKHGLVG